MPRQRLLGYLFIAVSASSFGIMPALAVLTYRTGMSVNTLLFYRFALAALVFGPWALVQARRHGERPPWRAVVLGLVMGALLYSGQATCYFTSVHLSSPALGALLLYLYPGIVALGDCLLARRRPTAGLLVALAVAFAGVVLSLGPIDGRLDPMAVVFGIGAALFYTAYILVGNHNGAALSSTTMSALVFVSAAGTYGLSGTLTRSLTWPAGPRAWAFVLTIGVVCTVVAIWFFFLGMTRVGPTMASLGSTLEPVGAVVGGALVIGTPMTGLQWLGAVLVITGAVLGMVLAPASSDDADAPVPVHEPAH